MSRFDSALRNFRTQFATIPAHADLVAELRMVEVNDSTRADPADVHLAQWKVDQIARKRERDQAQRLRDATPTPEFSTPRKGQEVA